MPYDGLNGRRAVCLLTERVLLRLCELRGSSHVEVGGVRVVHPVPGAIGLNQVPALGKLRDFQPGHAFVLRRKLFLVGDTRFS